MPPRKNKTQRKIGPREEEENLKALDVAAGVAPAVEITRAKISPAPPAPEKPLLVADTREKLLYRCALQGPGISAEFFDEFKDKRELEELTYLLTLRRLAQISANIEGDDKDVLASARILLNIEYGENASTDPNKFMPTRPTPAAPAMPVGATEGVDESLAKIRKLSGGQ